MAESQSWQDRLKEARQRMVFEPTPSGAPPHVATVEKLAGTLDGVEVAAAAGSPSSAAAVLASGLAVVLREMINARMYERNMAARFETQPDRIDELLMRVTQLLDGGAKR